MRITIRDVQRMKSKGERIPMVTAYDYAAAKLADRAGIPLILVGDSLGMTMLGYDSTIQVTMEDMLHHIRAVVRGTQRALVVGDLPFMTYQVDEAQALANAGRLMQEGGCQAVKLEGGVAIAATVRRIVEAGIPVMGHLGLTPQSIHQLGGYRGQGKTAKAAARLFHDAQALEEAGAFSVVLECIPIELAKLITERLRVPVIGIGAGPHCDGQVQVWHDILGLDPDFTPKHARVYADLGRAAAEGLQRFARDVQDGAFPEEAHSFHLPQEAMAELLQEA